MVKVPAGASELRTEAAEVVAEGVRPRRGLQMSVTVLCPNLSCKAILHVPDSMRGTMIRCGQCGTYLTVPAAGAAATAVKSSSEGDRPSGEDGSGRKGKAKE